MATIVTRAGKGSPLTHNEVDANFVNLNTDKAETASPTFTGQISIPDGTAAAPSLTNTGDTDTGVYFPSANTLSIATGGSKRVQINNTGVSFGDSGTSAYSYDFFNASAPTFWTPNGSANGFLQFYNSSDGVWSVNPVTSTFAVGRLELSGQAAFDSGTVSAPSITNLTDLNTGIYFPAADTLAIATGGVNRFQAGPSGQLGINGANYGTAGQLFVSGGSGAAPSWTDNMTAGITTTADNDGTFSSGTYTPTPVGGNMKTITNSGAFTFAAPSAAGDYTLVVLVANSATAGAITLSGFSRSVGDGFTTTNGSEFLVNITKISGFTLANVVALQ
jgi:hypothetical protein